MANFDTQDKRRTGIHISSPWRCILPIANLSFDKADRLTMAYYYCMTGVTAVGPVSKSRAFINRSNTSQSSVGGGSSRSTVT